MRQDISEVPVNDAAMNATSVLAVYVHLGL